PAVSDSPASYAHRIQATFGPIVLVVVQRDSAFPLTCPLSLHDALPIFAEEVNVKAVELSSEPAILGRFELVVNPRLLGPRLGGRSEEHTSELQSRENLVCRLLLEKKKNKTPDLGTAYPKDRKYPRTQRL